MGNALQLLPLSVPTFAAINGPPAAAREDRRACDQRVMPKGPDHRFVHASGHHHGWGGARYLLQCRVTRWPWKLMATGRVSALRRPRRLGLVDHVIAGRRAPICARTGLANGQHSIVGCARRQASCASAWPSVVAKLANAAWVCFPVDSDSVVRQWRGSQSQKYTYYLFHIIFIVAKTFRAACVSMFWRLLPCHNGSLSHVAALPRSAPIGWAEVV